MAQLISVRLHKADHQPLGFRLQGGKDFGTPLVIQKVNGGSAAEGAGLQAGDALIRVNNTDVYNLRHNDAQDAIRAAGQTLELTIQRGGGTWRPSVTPTGPLPRPGQMGAVSPVTKTSLKASPQPSLAFGSGHNNVAKPFAYMNGGGDNVKSIVNKQYNTPVGMYSDQTIAETLSAQTEVLAGGVLGVNFKKNEKSYDAEKSAVFKMLQEDSNDPEPEVTHSPIAPPISGLRHVPAPATKPDAPINNTGGLPPGQNICEECERLIIGVFVRIKDKNLHVECFKCATCGTSLKNQGYYNLNGKLYCDIHAKMVARQHPPAANLEPVTVPPGGKLPSGTYSSPLSSHTTPLPPLSTNNYSNGSSLFSPGSTASGPKPFGSVGSAYSPSLSPRSAPLSPATRPVPAPASTPAPAHAHAPVPPPTPENPTYYVKPEYKSAAEERLIRKMAKMALNGYEIGIQRKIKPGDHLQTMANQIQDTIVTKHPLNNENIHNHDEIIGMTIPEKHINGGVDIRNDSNYKNSSYYSPSYKKNHFDNTIKPNENILSIGDKIKDTIVKKHPSNHIASEKVTPLSDKQMHTQNSNINTQDILAHKTSSAPLLNNNENKNTANKYSNIIGATVDSEEMELQKYLQDPKMRAQFFTAILNDQTIEKQYNDFSSTKNDISKKYENDFNNTHTHIKNISNDVDEFKDIKNRYNKTNSEEYNNYTNTLKKSSPKQIEEHYQTKESLPKQRHEQDSQLYDNSFYRPRNIVNGNGTNGYTYNGDHTNNNGSLFHSNGNEDNVYPEILSDCKNETIVKMRQKTRDSSQDANKRDSKLISRPKSTITSLDLTDGTFPVCHVDNKAITGGPFITALGRIWCPDHFVCVNASCRRQLQDIGFVEENGQLYCEYCFEQFIAPACDKCHAKIKGDCLNAIGKHFHPECFNCVYCGKLFGNNPFFLEDGLPYCEADWNELFTTKCFACGFPVEAGDRWVEALNNNYHSQCFNCTMCKKNLEGQSFFAKGGRPFCKNHAR